MDGFSSTPVTMHPNSCMQLCMSGAETGIRDASAIGRRRFQIKPIVGEGGTSEDLLSRLPTNIS